MIPPDTNVVSAPMRDPPDRDRIRTSAVAVFEVRHGPSRPPAGVRRRALEGAFEALLREDFSGRVAPLDAVASDAAARLAAARERDARGERVAQLHGPPRAARRGGGDPQRPPFRRLGDGRARPLGRGVGGGADFAGAST